MLLSIVIWIEHISNLNKKVYPMLAQVSRRFGRDKCNLCPTKSLMASFPTLRSGQMQPMS